jgi:DNA polymerase III subunit delta
MGANTSSSIYCFAGPTALIEPQFTTLLDQLIPPAGRAVDLETAHVADGTVAALCGRLRLMPMIAPMRVAVLRDVETLKKKELAPLIAYITAPAPTGRLILLAASAPDEILITALRTTQQHYAVCSLERSAARAQLVQQFFKARGQTLTRDATQVLDELLRSPGVEAAQQLEQVSTYVGAEGQITGKDVTALFQPMTEHTVFQLVEAIGRGDMRASLALIAEHATSARRIPELFGLLGWYFRRLWTGRLQRDAGVSVATIARHLRLPGRAQTAFFAQVDRWTPIALRQACGILLQMDTRVKRSGGEPQMLLELTILTLTTLPDGLRAATSSAIPYSGVSHL